MASPCQWPAATPPEVHESGPQQFSLGGVIAGVRDTTPSDGLHPALMLVVEVGGEYARIFVPRAVWPPEAELLRVGQWVRVTGQTDSWMFIHGSRQVATELSLVVRCH